MRRTALLVPALLLLAAVARADVKLPGVFSDHMVLQQGQAVPVWGEATPGEEIKISFQGQTKTAKAGDDGKWRVVLDKLQAGGPFELSVDGKNSIKLADVLVGEVWIGSGQSNMDGGVGGYANGDPVLKELASKTYPKLRICMGRGGGWKEANPQTLPGFSALLFAFGQKLHQDLDVPVGLIEGAVGGTPSGRWLTKEMLDADQDAQKAIAEAAKKNPLEQAQARYQLALAEWEKAAEAAKQAGKNPPNKPQPPLPAGSIRGSHGDLYNQHIKPVEGFAIRGVLWDQGESGTALEQVDQYTTMGALIRGWRNVWNQGDFPFLYVQKPSGGGCAWDPSDPVTNKAEAFAPLPAAVPNDGGYREHHIRIQAYPKTAMVQASDLGSGIHPSNKSGYGYRAARVAEGLAYGKDVAISGPTYASHEIKNGKVRIKFAHVGQGLASKHGDGLQGFAIAGADKKFVWAEAKIDGDTVEVYSPDVPEPAAVRYAWSSRHPWANLFNKDGLPANTFRTDE